MSIVGLVPMAGTGSRLGLPFPKPLAPTFTDVGIRPLYWHAAKRLRRVTDRLVFVTGPEADSCLRDLPGEVFRKPTRGELPTSIGLVSLTLRDEDMVALALPDSIWYPEAGMILLRDEYERMRRAAPLDGVLATFTGSSHLLDEVRVAGGRWVQAIRRHDDPPARERIVDGWGAFLIRADALRRLSDAAPLAQQLERLRLSTVHLGHAYYDLGTPERYQKHMDQRRHGDPV